MKKLFVLLIIIVLMLILIPIITIYPYSRNTSIVYNDHYLSFSKFDRSLYSEYESARIKYNLSFLEALNTVNNPTYYEINSKLDALYLNTPIVLVNKKYVLKENYIPNNLTEIYNYDVSYIKRENEVMLGDEQMLNDYEQMYYDALQQNIKLIIFSAYRSFTKQKELFNNSLDNNYVALPGQSEHQTGLSLDISTLEYGLSNYFTNSKEFEYLMNNCHRFGFILRYKEEYKSITKYNYEPWHFRYVGKDASNIIHKNNYTLEEYLFKYYEI